MVDFDTRVGAYGLIVEGDEILLVHFNALGISQWTLPGGGLEVGEDGEAAAVREIREETGHQVALEGLLAVDSVHIPASARLDGVDGGDKHLHLLRLIYQARIIDGVLKREVDGSTDDARWFRIGEVPDLERSNLVNIGINRRHQAGGSLRALSPATSGASPD